MAHDLNLFQNSKGDTHMKEAVSVEQTVQEWGNGLARRISCPVAKAARFTCGLPIKVEVVEGGFS